MMEEGKEWCGEHITYNGFKTIFEVWHIKFFLILMELEYYRLVHVLLS